MSVLVSASASIGTVGLGLGLGLSRPGLDNITAGTYSVVFTLKKSEIDHFTVAIVVG
jgi:hypothetical protein